MGKLPRSSPYTFGYWGFFGFLGFGYFYNYDLAWLLLFSLFGLFGGFFIGNINKGVLMFGESGRLLADKKDERYVENSMKAGRRFWIAPIIGLLAVAAAAIFGAQSELIVVLCAAGVAATPLAYAILFYYYEHN